MRNTIKKRLVDVERHVRAALNKELSEVWSYVPALTTDHWTSNTNEGYASFTIHFINRTWELKSISMGVIPFSRPHTAVRVAELTEEIKDSLGWPKE